MMSEPATVDSEQSTELPIEDTAEVLENLQPIPVGRMQLQVEANNTFRVNVPEGTDPEQCKDESVWAHLAIMLKPGDEIIVMPDDMSWKLLLHVQGAGRNYVHVIEEVLYQLAPTVIGKKLPSIYKIEFKGTTIQWRVLRENRVLREGFASEGLAKRYAQNHEAAVTR